MKLVLFFLGAGTLAFTWLGPLPSSAPHAFWAHMTMHMAVVAVAAPLLALGLSGTRYDPAARHPALFAPLPASVIELVVVWAFHTPGLHHWARHHNLGLFVEQSLFLAVGLLVWLASVAGLPSSLNPATSERRKNRLGAGVLALLLTSMHMTLLGALLALAPRPLYAHDPIPMPGRLSPLQDQHVGGVIMLFVGGLSYLLGGLWLIIALLRQKSLDVNAPKQSPRSPRAPDSNRFENNPAAP